MKSPKLFLLCLAMIALSVAGYFRIKSLSHSRVEYSSLIIQNVEALTDNESEGEYDCKGFFGVCSFKCKHCGTDYWAIGSTFINRHNCKQK